MSRAVRRIALRAGTLENEAFAAEISARRGPASPGMIASIRWWQSIVGDQKPMEEVFDTLALRAYRPQTGGATRRRQQLFEFCPSDTVLDEAVQNAIRQVPSGRREPLLRAGLPGERPAFGYPFRIELVIIGTDGRALLTPHGGLALPVSRGDIQGGAFDPAGLAALWAGSLLGVARGIGRNSVRIPAMTHGFCDATWRMVSLVDLRTAELALDATLARELLQVDDPALEAVEITRSALREHLGRAADGAPAYAQVTGRCLLDHERARRTGRPAAGTIGH